jgi:hypothetical protein
MQYQRMEYHKPSRNIMIKGLSDKTTVVAGTLEAAGLMQPHYTTPPPKPRGDLLSP